MRKLLGISIYLLPIMLVVIAGAHAAQPSPAPPVVVLEQAGPVSAVPIGQDAAPPPTESSQEEPGEESQPNTTQTSLQEPIIQENSETISEEPPSVAAPPERPRPKVSRVKSYDIPSSSDPRVEACIKRAVGKDRDYTLMCLARFDKVRPTMERIFQEHGLPKDLVYVALVESGGNPHAVSPAGAAGYWQFLSGTARVYGLKVDRWVDERRDLEKSTHAAAVYLNHLYGLFDDWLLACAAYNAGEGSIYRVLNRHRHVDSFWDITRRMLYKDETLGFVPKILAAIEIGKHRERYGIKTRDDVPERLYDVVTVKSFATFDQIAELAGQPVAAIASLNPELTRKCIPPNVREYRLKVPPGTGEMVVSALGGTQDTNIQYASHIVQKGDTLTSIARKYRTSVADIAAANKMPRTDKLALGQELIIASDIYLKSDEKPTYAVAKADRPRRELTSEELAAPADDTPDSPAALKKTTKPSRLAKAKTKRRTYSVKKGDTIWSISRQFAVSPKDIMRWNDTSSQIRPGRKLIIYAKNT